MKKLLTILALALALCMLCGIALAADDSTIERDDLNFPSRVHDILNEGVYKIVNIHIDTEPTCTTPGIATVKCNNPAHTDYIHMITIPKIAHVMQDVDPIEYYLDDEGTTAKNAADDEDGDGTPDVEDPQWLCVNDLYKKQECAVCGYAEYAQINEGHADHNYVMGKVTTDPTCIAKGVKTAYCKYCGLEDPGWTEEIDFADHKFIQKEFDHITPENEPNCLNGMKGTYVLYCDVCGIYENDQAVAPATVEEWADGGRWTIHTMTMTPAQVLAEFGTTVDENGHTWKNLKKDVRTNACETLYQTDVCINCAEKRHIKIEGEEGADADYVCIGQIRIDCSHYYDEYQCTVCLGSVHENKLEEMTIENEDDYWHEPDWLTWVVTKNPTCTEKGESTIKCYDCGEEFIWELEPSGHAWTEYVLAVDGDDGYDIYLRTCLVCGMTDELVRPDTDPADTVNTYKYDHDDDPWCDQPGYHVYVSTDPAKDWVYVPFGAPLGHEWVAYADESVAATCTDDGVLAERCLRCGATHYTIVPATDHDYVEVPAVAPTCVDDGNELYYTCGNEGCDKLFDAEKAEIAEIPVIEKTGKHEADPAKDSFVAGTKCGEKTRIVKFCKYCPASWVEEDAVLEHDLALVAAVPATCAATGTEAYYKCQREGCTAIFADAEAATALTAPVVIEKDAANHAKALTKLDAVEATCTATGLEEAWTCEACGKIYSDAEGKTEIPAQKVIDKKDHAFTVLVSETAATCKADGVKIYKCATCDELKSEAVPFTGTHTLVPVDGKAATCKETGLKEAYKCSVCDKLFADAEGKTEIEKQEVIAVDEKAHVWVEEVITANTCKAAGVTLKTCSVCGKIEKIETPKLAHKYVEEITKEPEAGVKGEKTFTCSACGDTYTEEIPALPVPAVYTCDDLDYTKPVATGTATLDPTTDPLEGKLYARVSFFLANGDCMIQIVEVNKDGTFKAGAEGNFVHVSVVFIDVDDAYDADAAIEHAHGNGGKAL